MAICLRLLSAHNLIVKNDLRFKLSALSFLLF